MNPPTRSLELAYRWQTPVVVTSVAAIVLVSLLVRSGTPGAGAAVALVLVAWALLLAVVWSRTRAVLEVRGPTLVVRRFRVRREVPGTAVGAVREYLTGNGPCYKVYLTSSTDSAARPVHVPTGLLKAGHSTFFGWLDRYAPQAELDRGSRRTRERLRDRGLLPAPAPSTGEWTGAWNGAEPDRLAVRQIPADTADPSDPREQNQETTTP